jgi:hypothetical protein
MAQLPYIVLICHLNQFSLKLGRDLLGHNSFFGFLWLIVKHESDNINLTTK